MSHESDPLAAHRRRAQQLLGLRDFEARKPEDFFSSKERLHAWQAISTNTLPQKKKAEMKRNIVLEVLDRNLIPVKLFENKPVVYIGSGVDIEYPLSLGARHILLVDPIFASGDAIKEVEQKIRNITGIHVASTSEGLHFSFDFNEGPVPVTVRCMANSYTPESATEILPDSTGCIILFASQSSEGQVGIDEIMKSKLATGGIILKETDIITLDTKRVPKSIALGREA